MAKSRDNFGKDDSAALGSDSARLALEASRKLDELAGRRAIVAGSAAEAALGRSASKLAQDEASADELSRIARQQNETISKIARDATTGAKADIARGQGSAVEQALGLTSAKLAAFFAQDNPTYDLGLREHFSSPGREILDRISQVIGDRGGAFTAHEYALADPALAKTTYADGTVAPLESAPGNDRALPSPRREPDDGHRETVAAPATRRAAIQSTADIGRKVRDARRAMGMTQQHFADLAGVGRRFLGELERGKATLEIGRVLAVCEAAGIKLGFLS